MLNKSHLREVLLNQAKRGEVGWHFDPLSGTSCSLQKEVEEATQTQGHSNYWNFALRSNHETCETQHLFHLCCTRVRDASAPGTFADFQF